MEEEKSKSQVKRELKALQDLGASLTKLSGNQLQQVPLSTELNTAIQQFKSIKNNAAKQRQLKFIGRLMRNTEDTSPIQKAYDEIVKGKELGAAKLHLIEDWRTRLISDDKQVLTEFIQLFSCAETQQLRLLIRKAKADYDQQKNRGASKALFRFIADLIT